MRVAVDQVKPYLVHKVRWRWVKPPNRLCRAPSGRWWAQFTRRDQEVKGHHDAQCNLTDTHFIGYISLSAGLAYPRFRPYLMNSFHTATCHLSR